MAKAVLIAAIMLLASGLSAQGPAEEDHLLYIEGVVVDKASKEPIARALVRASVVGGPQSFLTHTDPSGRFRIRDLEPGDYSLGVEKRGYLRYSHGSAPGVWSPAYVSVKPGIPAEDLRLEMRRPGVLTGRVTDENGEPFEGTQVEVTCAAPIEDEPCNTSGQAKTDDQGVFRIFNVSPGRYIVSAKPESQGFGAQHYQPSLDDPEGRLLKMDYLKTYYPFGFDRSQASFVDVHSGSETGGIEIRLDLVETLSVSGRVISPSKPKSVYTNVSLRSFSNGEYQESHSQSYQDREGRFAFDGLAPGTYVLIAEYQDSGVPVTDWLEFQLTNESLRGVELQPHRGVSVRGHVSFDDPDVNPEDWQIYVSLRPEGELAYVAGRSGRAALDGSFALHGVLPGRYRFSVAVHGTAGDYYYADAVFVESKRLPDEGLLVGQDTSIGGVEVRAARAVSLQGVVLGEDSELAPGAIVALSSSNSEGGFSDPMTALTNAEGRFHMRPVFPGEQMLFAFPQGTSGAQITPERLRTVKSRGHKIEVGKDDMDGIDLRVIEQRGR